MRQQQPKNYLHYRIATYVFQESRDPKILSLKYPDDRQVVILQKYREYSFEIPRECRVDAPYIGVQNAEQLENMQAVVLRYYCRHDLRNFSANYLTADKGVSNR